jgi:hypothetical protein
MQMEEALVAAIFCWLAVVLVLACAVLHFTRWRKLASWLLVIFPAALCAGLWLDLSHDSLKPGQPGYHFDLAALPYLFGFLVVTVIAALRPRWRWIFWILWAVSALISVLLVFFTFLFG